MSKKSWKYDPKINALDTQGVQALESNIIWGYQVFFWNGLKIT
jgi:hypothetical protein